MARRVKDSPRTALVVDDDPVVANFVRDVLVSQGFEVTVAQDGKTASLIFKHRSRFSLIVTDILMPDEDGIQFIMEIRRSGAGPQPKIIAMSGGGRIPSDFYLKDASLWGADATLAKPFSDIQLIEALSGLKLD